MTSRLERLLIALERDELYFFFTGENEDYRFVCPYADMPTYTDQVFDAIKDYYIKNTDLEIWNKFETTITEMTRHSENVWLTVYYLSDYLSYRRYTNNDYIDLDRIINCIVSGLIKFKKELMKNMNWGGNQFKNGLWDDAVRLISILNDSYKLNIKLNEL